MVFGCGVSDAEPDSIIPTPFNKFCTNAPCLDVRLDDATEPVRDPLR